VVTRVKVVLKKAITLTLIKVIQVLKSGQLSKALLLQMLQEMTADVSIKKTV